MLRSGLLEDPALLLLGMYPKALASQELVNGDSLSVLQLKNGERMCDTQRNSI